MNEAQSMKIAAIAAAVPLLLLGACERGTGDPGDTPSEKLEAAAERSDPAAAAVLTNAAEQLEGQDNVSLSSPDSPVQKAMNEAANAQAANPDDTNAL